MTTRRTIIEKGVSQNSELQAMLRQIAARPEFLVFLNDTYPELSPFNKHAAGLIRSKNSEKLSPKQCLDIVRFCIHNKTSVIKSSGYPIHIETANQL